MPRSRDDREVFLKGKILTATYRDNGNDKTSYVRKATKWGTFSAVTECAEEDLDVANEWDGQYFAELLCDIQAQEAKAKEFAARARGVQHLYNVISKDVNENNPMFLKVKRQLYIAKRDAELEKEKAKKMRQTYPELTEAILKSRRKVREKFSLDKDE